MRFGRAIVFINLLLMCFMWVGQSAKADDITFADLLDGTTVSGSTRLGGSCGPTEAVFCTVTLSAPSGFTFGSTDLPHQFPNLGLSLIGIGEGPGPSFTNLSDALGVNNGVTQATITFESDPPASPAGDPSFLCLSVFDGVQVPCDTTETGQAKLVGTIQWVGPGGALGPTDRLFVASDLNVVPEPASLILFGSGLAITGGFLRRRRRVVTPSA